MLPREVPLGLGQGVVHPLLGLLDALVLLEGLLVRL
jgi:hypothetical protein